MREGAHSKPMGLTIKQENFCNYYLECGNASEAYRRAYNAANMKDETIWSRASKLLAEYKVSTRVEELRKQANDLSRITKERILKELSNMAFSSISEMHNTWIERKEFDKLTNSQKASIKSISTKVLKKNIGTKEDPQIVDVEFVKIELYDKIKAIECINKMLGYNEPEKVDVGIREPMTNAKAKEIIEKLGL
jgi:hypothetical protein